MGGREPIARITNIAQLSEKELIAGRIAARSDLYFYARWMFLANKNRIWAKALHHAIICQVLEDVFYGRRKNVIINIAPRYSKTELAVKQFVSWSLGKVPDANFIHISYGAPLAQGNSAETRDQIQTLEYQNIFNTQIDPNAAGKEHWKTTDGGVFYATGDTGAITGFGAGVMGRDTFGGAIIIDDPHKPDEALSKPVRERVWTRFQNTVESRRNDPSTPIIVIMQRLHVEDLAGKLSRGDSGEHYDVISIPALHGGQRDEDELIKDILYPKGSFRDGNEFALWPAKHSKEKLLSMEKANTYVFAGQYRQRPAPLSGGFFKPDLMPILEVAPLGIRRHTRGWDFAASEMKGDWTAGVLVAMQTNGRPIILDVKRDQAGPDKVVALLKTTANNDKASRTEQSIPQDPGQAGVAQVSSLGKHLAGCKFHSSTESGDKSTRAAEIASQINVGNVDLLAGSWNKEFIEELKLYPNGSYDDQVDGLSRAYNRMTEAPDFAALLDKMNEGI